MVGQVVGRVEAARRTDRRTDAAEPHDAITAVQVPADERGIDRWQAPDADR